MHAQPGEQQFASVLQVSPVTLHAAEAAEAEAALEALAAEAEALVEAAEAEASAFADEGLEAAALEAEAA